MDTKSWMMLKVLINRFNPKAGSALLKFLPQEEAQKVANINIASTDITPLLNQPQRLLDRMHYSWVAPYLEKFPPNLIPFAMGAFSPSLSAKLGKSLAIQPMKLSPPIKAFMVQKIYSMMNETEHLPVEYLPESELSPLLNWKKNELVRLIDYLGLYDLSSEIRHIVNKKYLDNLYSCLSQHELYYLKLCLYQKEKLVSPKLGINPTEKNPEKLKSILHQRGISRLGKALSGQHPDLIWYVVHTLDVGRGKILLGYCQKEQIVNVTSILKSQVINVMNFLKKE